jgi:MoaA/NifB/PqqE/SkfB family radical SAM enzyme
MDILDSLNEDWDSVSFCHLSYLPKAIADSHNLEHPDFIMGPKAVWDVNPLKVDVQKLKRQVEQIKKRRCKAVRFVPDLSDEDLELWYTDPLQIKKDARRCSFPWINANIASDGKIVPLVGCGGIVFGDIKTESFKKIWNNEKFRNFRIRMRKAGKFPACFGCCSLK